MHFKRMDSILTLLVGLSSGKKQEQLEIINKEFVELLSTFPDKQLPLK